MAENKTAPALYKRAEVAERLRISQRKADELLATGELASLQIGGRRLVSETALAKFVEKQERAGR
jgi:excisionase family DNA binding protein